MPILFYSTREAYGCFSNFSPHGITLNGKWWPTSEHYFQAQKFAGTDYEEQIRLAKTPRQAADLGRSRSRPMRPDWEQVKDAVMREAVLQKFLEHKDIQEVLLSTGDEELVENAPGDYYWGVGADGSGKNMLGRILMDVRAEIRARRVPGAGAGQTRMADDFTAPLGEDELRAWEGSAG
jgi:N-glycosidase YbiA